MCRQAPGLHSTDLRWRAIYKIWYDQEGYATVARHLSAGPLIVSERWVRDLWHRFEETGEVESNVGRGRAWGTAPAIDQADALRLIDMLLNNPEYTLQEHHAQFGAETGCIVHLSTFCRTVHTLGFTRQRVRRFASFDRRREAPS